MTTKLFFILVAVSYCSSALQLRTVTHIHNHWRSPRSNQISYLFGSNEDESEKTRVGSSEYFQGLISRSVNEEPKERISGDAILIPTLKFVGGISLVLILFLFGFFVSNGLI
ncbi:hypothetical protein ACHAXS_008678 [Conticribra weissflogii]